VFKLNRNVWLLAFAGALALSTAPLVVFVGGLVGSLLADDKSLATLPVAAIVLGTASAVIPVARLMQKFGRQAVFLGNIVCMAAWACLASYAIEQQSFWAFNAAVFLLGTGLAVIQQYRFAAMESVAPKFHAPAASFVLLGGLVAAFLGPELGQQGRALLGADFSGAFVLLAGVLLLSLPMLIAYRSVPHVDENDTENSAARSLVDIAKQPVFWVAVLGSAVAYAVMSFVMTATPVSMHNLLGHSLYDTKWVIQIHICAMYVPSFFSGFLIQRFGQVRMMWAGLGFFVASLATAWLDTTLVHFYISLICLGIGWNLLFVSGTSLLPQAYRASERFKVQGVNDFSVFGLQAIAALSSGVVVYQFGWQVLLLCAIPVLFLQVILLLFWNRPQSS
jgi:MFS family permease